MDAMDMGAINFDIFEQFKRENLSPSLAPESSSSRPFSLDSSSKEEVSDESDPPNFSMFFSSTKESNNLLSSNSSLPSIPPFAQQTEQSLLLETHLTTVLQSSLQSSNKIASSRPSDAQFFDQEYFICSDGKYTPSDQETSAPNQQLPSLSSKLAVIHKEQPRKIIKRRKIEKKESMQRPRPYLPNLPMIDQQENSQSGTEEFFASELCIPPQFHQPNNPLNQQIEKSSINLSSLRKRKKRTREEPRLFISPHNEWVKKIPGREEFEIKNGYCFTFKKGLISVSHKNPDYPIATLTEKEFHAQVPSGSLTVPSGSLTEFVKKHQQSTTESSIIEPAAMLQKSTDIESEQEYSSFSEKPSNSSSSSVGNFSPSNASYNSPENSSSYSICSSDDEYASSDQKIVTPKQQSSNLSSRLSAWQKRTSSVQPRKKRRINTKNLPANAYFTITCPHCSQEIKSYTKSYLIDNFIRQHMKQHPEQKFDKKLMQNNLQKPEQYLQFSINCPESSCKEIIRRHRKALLKEGIISHLSRKPHPNREKYSKESIKDHVNKNYTSKLVPNPNKK